jgi:hypothetical protein
MCANHLSGDRAILMVFCIRRKAAQRDCRSSHRADGGRGTDRRRERPTLPSLAIHLGRTKTSSGDHDEVVYLTGQPVKALSA